MPRSTAGNRFALRPNSSAASLAFNGARYVSVADVAAHRPAAGFSVRLWIQPRLNNPAIYGGYLVKTTSAAWNDGWGVIYQQGLHERHVRFFINHFSSPVSADIPGGWVEVVGTYDRPSGATKIYVNGVLKGSSTRTANITVPSVPMLFGAGTSGLTYPIISDMSDVRFYDRVLTLAEVEGGYFNGTHATSGLVSSWPCYEGSGTAVVDVVGGYNGTLNAAAWTTRTPWVGRATASNRISIRPYTQSWKFNGATSTSVTSAPLDLSAHSKIVVDFWFLNTGAAVQMAVEHGTNASVSKSFVFDANDVGRPGSVNVVIYHTNGTYTNVASAATALKLGQWYHVVGMFDRSQAVKTSVLRLWVDGVGAGTAGGTWAVADGNFPSASMYVGSRAGASFFYNGNIKDLRICSYTGTFDASDAAALYYENRIPARCTQIHRWKMDTAGNDLDENSAITLNPTNVTYVAAVPTKARSVA